MLSGNLGGVLFYPVAENLTLRLRRWHKGCHWGKLGRGSNRKNEDQERDCR
jgi:hypothetical protein